MVCILWRRPERLLFIKIYSLHSYRFHGNECIQNASESSVKVLSGSYLICIHSIKIVRESSHKCICFALIIFVTLHHIPNVQGLCHSSELDATFSRICIERMSWMIFDGCMYWRLECILSSHRQCNDDDFKREAYGTILTC